MLKKKYRLRKKKEYIAIYRNGEKYIGKYVLIYKKLSDQKKIGFSISKKIGNAVIRNLYKRRFRYIIKKYFSIIKTNEYIFIANKLTKKSKYKELEEDILFLIKKINNNNSNIIID